MTLIDSPVPTHPASEEPDHTAVNAPLDPQVADYLGEQIAGGMASIYVTVKRFTGRLQSRTAKIEIADDAGKAAAVDPNKLTKPCYRIDIHPIWKKIDATESLIRNTVMKYTANDGREGDHLVVMSKLPALLAELVDLREQRLSMVRLLRDQWEKEVIPGITAAFPDHYGQIIPRLPNPLYLEELFDVRWVFRPLTPMTPDQLDIASLNPEDRAKVIEKSNAMIKEMARAQAQNVFNGVFGEVALLCQKVEEGALESGRRKSAALQDMLLVLDRIHNFAEYATTTRVVSIMVLSCSIAILWPCGTRLA